MLLNCDDSQLVLVDFQLCLLPAVHGAAEVEQNALRLTQLAGMLKVPTVATEQNPSKLGASVPALQSALAQAGAKTLDKMQFSAVDERLLGWLRPPAKPVAGNARSLPKHLQKPPIQSAERSTIVLAGIEAHVCLLQTAIDLLEHDFDVWVVTDACSSRTERNRDAAFDRLATAGIELLTTEMVLFEWIRSAEHPAFKAAQALIR